MAQSPPECELLQQPRLVGRPPNWPMRVSIIPFWDALIIPCPVTPWIDQFNGGMWTNAWDDNDMFDGDTNPWLPSGHSSAGILIH